MEKKYISVLPGNIKGADDARTDILTLLGISVDPMSNPEINNGRMSEPVAALLIDGKMYDLKSVLEAFVAKMLPIELTEPATGDVLVYDADDKVFKNVTPATPFPFELTTPTDGDILVYDGDDNVFKNVATEVATT